MADVRTKPWTVMFYIVADPDEASVGLNAAAQAEVDAIAAAAGPLQDDLYVVCQVDFNGPAGTVRMAIDENGIHPVPLAPEDASAAPGDRDALRRFFTWGSKTFPSDRQAVFFWGHSFGPGGLFTTVPNGPNASPLSKSGWTLIFDQPVAGGPAVRVSSRVLSMPDLASALQAATGRASKRLDLVVFKDCFMNTLEVAYELGTVADFQLGGPGRIPIYLHAPADGGPLVPSVWPYEQMFAGLAASATAAEPAKATGLAMLDALGNFYANPSNRGEHDDVPLALLDLRVIDETKEAVDAFVSGVTATTALPVRSAMILGCPGGDPALVDVLTMCDRFPTAASGLKAAVQRHIVDRRSRADVCMGMSIFYRPPGSDRQGNVMEGLYVHDYDLLRLSRTTRWDEIAFESSRIKPAL